MFGLGDFVFEGRNKKYGAYVLRKKYHKHLFWGFIGGQVLVVVPILLMFFNSIVGDLSENVQPQLKRQETMEFMDIPMMPVPLAPPPETQKKEHLPTPPEIDQKENTPEEKFETNNKPMAEAETKNADSLNQSKPEEKKSKDTIFLASDVDQLPVFIGGEMEFRKFWLRSFVCPKMTEKKQFKLYIEFWVSASGYVETIKINENIPIDLEKEIKRVLVTCPPWKPAVRRGKNVSIKLGLPLIIKNY
jgi:periplasmic protein TonB